MLVPLTPAARFCARTSSFCPKACCGHCTRTVLPAAYCHGPPPCQVSAMRHKAFRVLPKKECEGGRRSQYKGHQPGASHISTDRRITQVTHSLPHSLVHGRGPSGCSSRFTQYAAYTRFPPGGPAASAPSIPGHGGALRQAAPQRSVETCVVTHSCSVTHQHPAGRQLQTGALCKPGPF